MVDVTTAVLGFVKQTIGGNRNTWGNILNTNFDLLEEAICGRQSIPTTGGTTTLTQAQARKRFLDVTGALTTDATIVVPNASKDWIIANSTSGGFGVLVKTLSGVATSVPQGTAKRLMCDGVNGVVREDAAEVGQMAFFGQNVVPPGWFEASGLTKSRVGDGIDLFAKIATIWGAGNGISGAGGTFTLPDGYTAAKFLRSRSASVPVGTAQTDLNKTHQHAGGTTAANNASHSHGFNVNSGGQSVGHTHGINGGTGNSGVDHTHQYAGVRIQAPTFWPANGGGTAYYADINLTSSAASAYLHSHPINISSDGNSVDHLHNVNGNTGTQSANHAHTFDTPFDGGSEARPTNLSALLCIKY